MKHLIFLAVIWGTPALADNYPFEGRWSGQACKTAYVEYSSTAVKTVSDPAMAIPPEVCKMLSVKPAGTDFVVQMSCKDESGDGPSTFKVTEKITISGDKLTKTSSAAKGQKFELTRCPR